MNKKLNRVLAVALTIVALATGQTAWAESTWTVEVTDHNDNTNVTTFTITRSEKTYAQTVLYRTVGLSAYAGQHFTATSGSISFGKNEDSKTVEVTEKTPAANAAYKYQSGSTSRSYKLEVTDRAGYLLKGCTRNINYDGTSINSSNAFAEKSVTVSGGTNGIITVTDAGFTQAYYAIPIADYYTAAAPKDYLVAAGAELRMKVEFEEAEKDDGYQHIQLLVNQTSQCDNSANKGNPGDPNKSRYLASFAHKPGSTLTSYAKVCFPLTSASDNCSEIDPAWNFSPYNNSVGKLYTQKFKSGYRDSDGRLIIALKTELSALSSVGIRFDASGDNNDTWYAKNTVAKIQAVDLTYPSRIAMTANPGRHAKYNSFYVSVALSEIVTSTNATLSTSWGPMTLEAGSGTNVLTFKGTIKADASGALNVTSWSGNITDLSGHDLNICGINFFNQDNLATLDADFAYTLDDFQQEDGNYLIQTHEDLIGLAGYVNGGGDTEGKTFLQVGDIAFSHVTNWNSSSSTENNYTAIGYYNAYNDNNIFEGTYDGGGYTISGIRIYRNNNTDSDNNQGIFGLVKSKGAIRNVNLSDTRITGRSEVGGIVGYNNGTTVEDCTVAADVCIHQINSGGNHGGVVGHNSGSVKRCISRARLTVKNGISTSGYGGIVGYTNRGTITDCIATDVVIPDVNARGAIVGVLYNNTTLTRNYYHGCKVASDNVTPSGVGQGTAGSKTTSDVDGARALWAITLGTNVTIDRTPATDPLPGTNNMTYDNGADIEGVPYAYAGATVTLNYTGEVATDYHLVYSTTAGTLEGNTLTMPAEDVTVTAEVVQIPVSYIDADGATQTCNAYTTITDCGPSWTEIGTSGQENWYVVSSDATISGTCSFINSHTHLIVCDGVTLTINGYNAKLLGNYGSLTIYGQSGGSGNITANTGGQCLNFNGNVTINGCTINATSELQRSIYGSYNVIINRGTVTATSSQSYGIVGDNVTINGGTVSATGGSGYAGIFARKTITLGWTTPADRIYASSYTFSDTYGIAFQVKDGQTLTDGTNAFSSTLNSDQIAALAGQTLQPAAALAMNSAGICTYASPYALDLSNVNAYVVSSYSNTNSTLTLTKVTEAPANTGLLLKAKNDEQKGKTIALPLQESAEAVGTNLLVGVLSGATIVPKTYGSYTNFILANGKYGIDWYTLSEAGAIGANKAYLQLPTAEVSSGRAFTWVYDDGTATKIERPTPDPSLYGGEWYTLNGVKLSGKPTTKGLYIHNGRKEVVR